MVLYAIIGLILASFVVAFFSARTWHWGYVVVVELILLATAGFFILAAETVRINAVLRKQVNDLQKQVDTVDAQNDALQNGTSDSKILTQLAGLETPVKMPENAESILSIGELDHRLLMATRFRGRLWRKVMPVPPVNAQTGAVAVNISLKPETVVYLLEDGPVQAPAANGAPRGAQYLGEFSVTQAAPQQATLLPVLPLDEFERRRLAASHGPWVIYEDMPKDNHEIFAGKTDQQLKQLLPAKSVGEYIRDGKPATSDDDPARVIGLDENGKRLPPADLAKATKKVYQRRLRDYASEFDDLARRRVVMLTDIDALKKDIARLTEAHTIGKKLQADREEERRKLNTDLAGVKKERETIEHHVAQINQELAHTRELLAGVLRSNDQLAAQLAARQLRPRQRPAGRAAVPQ
jgi:hypothetical protein